MADSLYNSLGRKLDVGGGGGSSSTLNGKKYCVLGDSISYRNHYQRIIDNALGTTHKNLAVSGAGFHLFVFHNTEFNPNTQGDTETTGWDRLMNATDFDDCDFVLLCGYANSVWYRLGTMEDSFKVISEEECSQASSVQSYANSIANQSFYAQAKSVIDYLTRICPNKPILISGAIQMSRPKDSWNTGENTPNFKRVYINGATTRTISDALKEVANYYGLPYVDLERDGGVNGNNYTLYYTGNDLVHPNYYPMVDGEYPNSGMKRMAVCIADAMHKLFE